MSTHLNFPAKTSALVCGFLLLATMNSLQAKIDRNKIGLSAALDASLAPALLPVEDVPGLPRVLIIGDSISIGYTREVRHRLAGRANVHRPPDNCGPTVFGLEQLDGWLGAGKWDVVYFSFGLHDLKFMDSAGTYIVPGPKDRPLATPLEYAANLRQLVGRLQRTGARLVFANTTPVPGGTVGRLAGSERAYNTAAEQVMRETGVTCDDLHAFVTSRPHLQRPNNVHFTPEGCEALADQVAATITTILPAHRLP
ncbi:MAG: SGNH/GDSL hydrolase family protein [Lacunisphaera sp.]|nr:SGNH/GDSL hydrolase family protein [Lacunisphaera sp.]